jgi:hypothetical protein
MMMVLFRNRHKVLTFMTPRTAGIVDRLASLPVEDWTLDDIKK